MTGRWRRQGRRAPVILTYQRVRPAPKRDPYGMSVTPEHLREQLAVLAASGRPVLDLTDLARRHAEGRVPPGAVAVTFDGGYAQTADAARILADLDLPATVFVTSHWLGAAAPWWDQLADLLLSESTLPDSVEVRIGERAYDIALGPPPGPVHDTWRHGDRPVPTPRHLAFDAIWTLLMAAARDEREEAVAKLDAALGPAPAVDDHRLLGAEELVAIRSRAPVSIGSHTASHLSLPRVPHRPRETEIAGARRGLEEIAGRPIAAIAYPYGHVDADIAAAARHNDHVVGVTRRAAPVVAGDDVMRLPRLAVGDWTGEELTRRLAAAG